MQPRSTGYAFILMAYTIGTPGQIETLLRTVEAERDRSEVLHVMSAATEGDEHFNG